MSAKRKTASGRVTIYDVAADAGVSFAAVSKVVREAYGVSNEMRAKVNASIAKLGYRPHTAARGMRGRTFTLGIVLPDIRNPFFGDVVEGVQAALKDTQFQASISINQTGPTLDEAMIDSMMDQQVDGFLIVGATDQEQLERIGQRKPLVTIGNHAPSNQVYDTVNNEDRSGAALAVEHLAGRGYKSIAMFSLRNGSSIIAERESGYRNAMVSLGLGAELKIVHARTDPDSVQEVARAMLSAGDRPEAVFCWTDFVALEVISAATTLGLKVPNDFAIVGYDNTHYCDLAQNSLTSVDQSGQVLGSQAAQLLLERIRGRTAAVHYKTTPDVVVRGSSGRHAAAT